jgi:hypothetical protein
MNISPLKKLLKMRCQVDKQIEESGASRVSPGWTYKPENQQLVDSSARDHQGQGERGNQRTESRHTHSQVLPEQKPLWTVAKCLRANKKHKSVPRSSRDHPRTPASKTDLQPWASVVCVRGKVGYKFSLLFP